MIKKIYLLWFIFNISWAYLANRYDVYNEHFIYKFTLYHYQAFVPHFLISFANYDGANYLHIAHDGYKSLEQSFFPLFPLTIHILSTIFLNYYFLPGFFLANISFVLGLYIFQKNLKYYLKKGEVLWTIIFFLAFPTSFFFNAVYTEGLFFLLLVSSLYFIEGKKYWLAALAAFFSGLTRTIGLFLIIPLLIAFIAKNHQLLAQKDTLRNKIEKIIIFFKKRPLNMVVIIAPILGLLTYMIYLSISYGDPLAFYHVSYVFGPQRSSHIILLPQVYFRYIAIFMSAQRSFIYYVAVLEFVIFNFVLLVLCYDFAVLWKSKKNDKIMALIGLNLFSFCNLLLPTLSGSLSSMPRYVLLSLSFFIRLGQVQNVPVKIVLFVIFAILHGLLLWLFIQGYFIS